MSAIDYNRLQAHCPDTAGTILSFDKKTASILIDNTHFSCFRRRGGEWSQIDFPKHKNVVLIGGNPRCCDIHLSADTGTVAKALKLKGGWMLVERARIPVMKVNGVLRRQAFIANGAAISVEINGEPMILRVALEDGCPAPERNGDIVITAVSGGKRFSLPNGGALLFGSHRSCDIPAAGEPFSAVISECDGVVGIAPVGEINANGTRVNGHLLTHSKALKGNEKISVGDQIYTLSEITGHGFKLMTHPAAAGLRLIEIENGFTTGIELNLPPPGQSLIVGRSRDCGLQITSTKVSREHAQMIIYENSLLVMDCRSTNGTFVNGARTGKGRVHPGDILTIGNTMFLLCHAD